MATVKSWPLVLMVLGLAGCVAAPPPIAIVPGQTAYGTSCYAGVYTCQLPAAGPLGSTCSCPALGAPSYGTIR